MSEPLRTPKPLLDGNLAQSRLGRPPDVRLRRQRAAPAPASAGAVSVPASRPQIQLAPPPPVQVRLRGGTVARYDFVDFHRSSDLRNVSSASFEQCASICIASPDCGAVTYATDQQRCYLKARPGNPKNAPSAVSGIVTSR